MPVFNFICSGCFRPTKKLVKSLGDGPFNCPACGSELVHNAQGPTARVVEIRDNGFMPKKVEQLAGIEGLIRNRGSGTME